MWKIKLNRISTHFVVYMCSLLFQWEPILIKFLETYTFRHNILLSEWIIIPRPRPSRKITILEHQTGFWATFDWHNCTVAAMKTTVAQNGWYSIAAAWRGTGESPADKSSLDRGAESLCAYFPWDGWHLSSKYMRVNPKCPSSTGC